MLCVHPHWSCTQAAHRSECTVTVAYQSLATLGPRTWALITACIPNFDMWLSVCSFEVDAHIAKKDRSQLCFEWALKEVTNIQIIFWYSGLTLVCICAIAYFLPIGYMFSYPARMLWWINVAHWWPFFLLPLNMGGQNLQKLPIFGHRSGWPAVQHPDVSGGIICGNIGSIRYVVGVQ